MFHRLNYNSNTNNELQESPLIIPNSKPAPPNTKKVWRLKKYHRSEDEIKTQQESYENLEFNTKKTSTRRPKNKNGGQQEFVFIDLSPTKKNASKDNQPTPSRSSVSTPSDSNAASSTTPKKQGRVSRLFRLSNSNDEIPKEQSAPPTLMSQPQPSPQPQHNHHYKHLHQPIPKGRVQPISTIPSLPPHQNPIQAPIQAPPALKRSYTTANAARYKEKSSSSTSLVMTVSENGRAVLQPTASRTLSTSSSVSDLFSLTRVNSSRQSLIPSPKRMESPIHQQHLEEFSDFDHPDDEDFSEEHDEYEDGDECDDSDATKAFSKIIKKQNSTTAVPQRKRANTASSTNSIISSPVVPRLLTRNHSISSMNSTYKSRVSPSRSNLILRQTTLLQQQHHQAQQPIHSPAHEQNEFTFTSFFDDIHNNHNSNSPTSRKSIYGLDALHKKTTSISDNLIQLGPPLEINSSDNDPESPYTANTDLMLPFEFGSEGLDHTSHHHIAENNDHFAADDTMKAEDQFFDFNAFINYNNEEQTTHY